MSKLASPKVFVPIDIVPIEGILLFTVIGIVTGVLPTAFVAVIV